MTGPGLGNGLFAVVGDPSESASGTVWPVTIDVGALGTLPSSFVLNIPDREPVSLRVGSTESRGAGSYLWTGNGGDCGIVMDVASRQVAGTISCSNANYAISGEDTALELTRFDETSTGDSIPVEEGFAPLTDAEQEMVEQAAQGPVIRSNDNVIDILILYQEPVRQALDGTTGGRRVNTYLLARSCVDNLQQAINQSLAGAKVHLAGVSRVTRTSFGSVTADLQYLRTDPQPLALRNFWAADVVVYLTVNGNNLYGTSSIPGSTSGGSSIPPPGSSYAPLAEAVVQYNTAVADTATPSGQPKEPYVFLHEFAHVIGANHNHEDSTNTTPLEVSAYGYWRVNSAKGSDRTILSNPTPQCIQGGACTRIEYYSNPAVTFDWFRTGQVDYANNAMLINDEWSYATQYRASLGRIFFDGFDY